MYWGWGEATGMITKPTRHQIPQTRRKENADFAWVECRKNEIRT